MTHASGVRYTFGKVGSKIITRRIGRDKLKTVLVGNVANCCCGHGCLVRWKEGPTTALGCARRRIGRKIDLAGLSEHRLRDELAGVGANRETGRTEAVGDEQAFARGNRSEKRL